MLIDGIIAAYFSIYDIIVAVTGSLFLIKTGNRYCLSKNLRQMNLPGTVLKI